MKKLDVESAIKKALLIQEYSEEWRASEELFKSAVKSFIKSKVHEHDWKRLSGIRGELSAISRNREEFRQLLIKGKVDEAIEFTERHFYGIDSVIDSITKSMDPTHFSQN